MKNVHACIFAASSVATLLLVATSSSAAPRGFTDVRSSSMGGTGVAVSSEFAAPFRNPSLMAKPARSRHRNTNLLLPAFAAGVAMDEDLVDGLDDFQDNDRWENLKSSVDTFNNSDGSASELERRTALENALSSARNADRSLSAVDRSALQAELSFGSSITRTGGGQHAYGAFTSAQVEVSGIARYNDSPTVNAIIDTAKDALDRADNGDSSGLSVDLFDPPEDPSSNASVIGVAIGEVGLTYARNIPLHGWDVQIGVSPKYQHVRTFDYTANTESFDKDTFDAADAEAEESFFNMDIGLSASIDDYPGVSLGLSARNVVPHDIETASGSIYELSPLVQLGAAYTTKKVVLALEGDLTKVEGVGFEGNTQLISAGGEYSPIDWLHLRAGLSHNLARGEAEGAVIDQGTTYSAGLGISPGGGRVDLAAVAGEHSQYYAIQFGYVF